MAKVKWTLERCKADALQYQSRNQWRLNSRGYNAAQHNKWLDLCCGHMNEGRKPNGYWTLELCKADAKQHTTRMSWSKSGGGGYTAARRSLWLDECCAHMEPSCKPIGYWTKCMCKQDALNFNTRKEWQSDSNSAYKIAYDNNWLEYCCSHMIEIKKPKHYWSEEKCKNRALFYTSRSDWQKYDLKSYSAAHKNRWLESCCEHMDLKGNLIRRAVYAYFIADYVYVGLSCDVERRIGQHFRAEPAKILISVYGASSVKVVQLTSYINSERATTLEGYYLKLFTSLGLKPINKAKTGGLGGCNRIWTLEICIADAQLYTTQKDWRENSTAYDTALKNGWLKKCCQHMKPFRKPNGFWTKVRCIEDARKHPTRNEWSKVSPSAYVIARRRGWFEECCIHMGPPWPGTPRVC